MFYVCECADHARFYHLSPSDVELVCINSLVPPFLCLSQCQTPLELTLENSTTTYLDVYVITDVAM